MKRNPTTLLGNKAIRREKRGEDRLKPITLLGNEAIRRRDLRGGDGSRQNSWC